MNSVNPRKKIKVAEFVTRLEFGGVETMLLNYIMHFPRKEDFDFHVITQDRNDEKCIQQFVSSGFKVDIVTHKRTSIFRNVLEIYNILRTEKFDVVHCHMTLTNFYVLFLAVLCGVPVRISHSHNSFITHNPLRNLFWNAIKLLNKMVSNVWIACGYDAGCFLYGKRAVDSRRVVILNNAIDLSRFCYDERRRKKIRSDLGIGDCFCVGHVGRFVPQKNHRLVIDIFRRFHAKTENSKLLLIGTGELESSIREYVHTLKLEKAVLFLGGVTDSSIFYQAMDAFILPSLFEGLPVVAIEAQANGLPTLISDNVDKSCKLCDNVEFLPINDANQLWADALAIQLTNRRNMDSVRRIRTAHYDINDEARKLERIYSR